MASFLKKIPQETWLALAAILLLTSMLSAHSIWTQEYRWQQVCLHMLATHDYWHPYLDGKPYYDKPLLSYWLIVGLAKLNHGDLTNTILRLPSVLAGLLTLWCTYWLTKFLFDRETGLLAGWLLLTTFYFVFWARVASTDILNVAAIMVCLGWFFKYHAVQRPFWQDGVFFLLMAISALLKGLIAPVLVFIVLIPHLYRQQLWRSYLAMKPILAMLIAVAVYVSPFLISSMTQSHYTENGLVEVFRENILRFFQPFDHEGGWWTYFIYFPLYTLPWLLLLLCHRERSVAIQVFKELKTWIASLRSQRRFVLPGLLRSKAPRNNEHFPLWSIISIFIFLSLSGSRRSYYILPIVPFTMIFVASWWQKNFAAKPQVTSYLCCGIAVAYVLLCAYFLVALPYYYLHHLG